MKNILVVTTGHTPQIVTETVWALLDRKPQFVPSAIHLVTTAHGREKFAHELLGPDGRLAAVFRHFDLPPVQPEVHLPEADGGAELSDIRTAAECAAYANTVSRLIRRYAADPETRIHVSLAGGRKTMSYFAGAAISLFGRDQDELSHVLIEPEHFEQCLDFWHPAQPEAEVHHRNGRDAYDPAVARICIVDIPFMRLAHTLPEGAFDGQRLDYGGVLRHVEENLKTRRIRLIPGRRTIVAGPYEVVLRHREFALYRLAAAARLENWPGASRDGIGPEHKGWITYEQLLKMNGPVLQRFFEFYDEVYRVGVDETDKFEEFLRNKLGAGLLKEARDPFMQTLAKLNAQIEAKIANPAIRARVRVASAGRNPKRFGLALAPEEIEIDDNWR